MPTHAAESPLAAAAPNAVAADTLPALLRELGRRQPEREALVYTAFTRGGTPLRLTFAQLDAHVDALAWGLLALGIEPGEHVAVWAANVTDWVPLEFALARIGAVLVTVNTGLKREELGYLLRQSRAVAVLHTSRTGGNEASLELDALLGEAHPDAAGVRLRVWLPNSPDDERPLGVLPGGGKGALPHFAAAIERGAALRAEQPELLARREAAVRALDVVNI